MGYLPEELHCDNLDVANTGAWAKILTISLVIYAFLPVVVTVVLYIWMMCFAMTKSKPSKRSVSSYNMTNKEGVLIKPPNKALHTVSMIIGIYLISISLTIILIIVRIGTPDIPGRAQLASVCLWLLNTAVNPIIYVYNNPMFRAHLKRLILRKAEAYSTSNGIMQSLRRRTTQQSVVGMPHKFGRTVSQASSLGRESVVTSPTKMGVVREESYRSSKIDGMTNYHDANNHKNGTRNQPSVTFSAKTQESVVINQLSIQDVVEENNLVIRNLTAENHNSADPLSINASACVLTDESAVFSDQSRFLTNQSRETYISERDLTSRGANLNSCSPQTRNESNI